MKTKPKKKNPLSNPRSLESRVRRLEGVLRELSRAASRVAHDQKDECGLKRANLKRLDEALLMRWQQL